MNWKQFRQERKSRRRPLIVAHRGAPLVQPENTLTSFALALEQGADVLETDLRFTRDQQLVLFHDSTLERMTDGHGAVGDHTLADIQQLRTRGPDRTWTEQRVPTLVELIEQTQAQTPLLLELKDPRFVEPGCAQQLVALLDRYDLLERSAIISFHPEYVAAVQTACPTLPTGNITLWNPLPLGKGELLGPVWPLLYLNPLYVAWAHWRGKVVAPLDPRPEPRLRHYLRLRVDALLADNPAAVMAGVEKVLGESRRARE